MDQEYLVKMACLAHLVCLGLRDQMEMMDYQAWMVLQVLMVQRVMLAYQVYQVWMDHLVILAYQVIFHTEYILTVKIKQETQCG